MVPRSWPGSVLVLLCAGAFAALPAARGPELRFTSGDGTGWDPDTLGNHRVHLRVDRPGPVAHVVVPWRRPDAAPDRKAAILTDARGTRVANVRRGRIDRERGEFWFEPAAGPGRYFLYYLPYQSGGRSNYPKVSYPEPQETASPEWVRHLGDGTPAVEAIAEAVESIDAFNSFHSMEVIATREESDALLRRYPGAPFIVFPEDRDHPIRMRTDLPLRWVETGPRPELTGEARRGEYFAFQLGVYALQDLEDVQVRFSDLRAPSAGIYAAQLSCLNMRGVNWDGRPLVRVVSVPRGGVQAIWCGLDTPVAAKPGRYRGTARLTARGGAEAEVPLAITVLDDTVTDGGANEPWKQTRLKWLNSRLAQRNDVIPPYMPLEVAGNVIRLLGREVVLGTQGLPDRIATHFTPAMTALSDRATPVLAAPVGFVVELADGSAARWEGDGVEFAERGPGTARWTSKARGNGLAVAVEGTLEFDGFLAYRLALAAERDVELRDVRLVIPYTRAASTYMMGLGRKGGYRPASFDWTWDVARKNQDGAWIGGVNAGLFFSLRGDNYVRPLNTNFYLQQPLRLPPSWGNGGRGGIRIREDGDTVSVVSFSGPRAMKAGETLRYDSLLIVTPFHPLDTDFQWRTRFYHRYGDLDAIAATGATVINVHHATPVNPWINYPFIAHREMKDYIDEAHARGLQVKIYNTVRELSNRAHELLPMRSLGHEIFSPGPGGGFAWLQEHLRDDYIAAWFVPAIKDAAVINSGMSRWHNYYVEGLSWLVRNVGIDGIYIDDVAYDRTTMKRVKRVLTQDGHPGIVDLHSANQFNERDGFVNSAVLYLEHFPYVDRLWFGEYFDYEGNPPEFFLTEVSGIPFGLMGEMLEKGGNPWRGMLYGMTNRMPWSDNADPRPIWKAWDEFGMQGTEMIGYWVPENPVRTGRPDVLATVYRRPGGALVAVASWAETDVKVTLAIDWKALGLDPGRATIVAPAIDNFQRAERFLPGDAIPVPKGKGWMLVITEAR
jgi:hypothetical protein